MKAWVWGALLLGLGCVPLSAESTWTSFDVPADKESALVGDLEAHGVVAIGWSNAVVEISGFGPLVLVPLQSLGTRLTAPDPRWDPWLTSLKPSFVPRAGVSRIWVAPQDSGSARARLEKDLLAAGPTVEARKSGPRQTTGWMLVALALLYLGFRAAAQVASGDRRPVRWLWVLLPLAVAIGGWTLTRTAATADGPRPSASVSWSRHLWFQQAWPYGATWKDWKAGQPWSYDRFERKDGKIVATATPVPAPEAPSPQATFAQLDPHHAARIFGPENP